MEAMMKNNWEIKKIGEVCEVIAGQSPEGKFYNDSGNGLPFYQGKKEYGEKYIGKPTTWTTKVTKEAEKNDILMSVRAPVGPINFATQKICIGRGLAAIRATKLIDKGFLFNFLLKHGSEIVGNTGAVFNSINKAQIEDIQIPIPPLKEQLRIVSILDEVFAGIERSRNAAEKNLKNAKEIFESYLQNVFENKGEDWEEKTLGEVVKLEYGKPLDNSKRKNDGKYPMYGANGIKGRTDKFYHNKKTIIIGRKGSAGEINLTDEKFWPLDVTYFICFDEKLFDLYFLNYLLRKLELPKLAKGVKPGINRNDVYQLVSFFPKSLKTQQEIVKKLDALQTETKKLEVIYEQKIVLLQELKKSVLERAFSGELITE